MRAATPSGLPGGAAPRRRRGTGLRQCHVIVLTLTIALGVALFYVYLFTGLQRVAHPGEAISMKGAMSPLEAPRVLGEAAHAVADRFMRKCPACPSCADADEGEGGGGGGGGFPDPDAWLDRVGEDYPKLVPSHYAMVHGLEPYERPNQKVWDLHVIPTDDWYERGKKATDRCDLELTQKIQGAENGLEDKVVWVSALFDLKRGEAGMGDFQRGMDEYYRRFQIVLDRGFQMIIFIPTDFEKHLKIDYTRVKVIYMNATDLKWYLPYYDRVQSIRTSQLWVAQSEAAGWLKNAPQARLEGYNPLVMSKIMMLRDAARMNPWGSRYHMWMDAGHLCAGAQSPQRQDMYRRHMAKAMLVTHWPYGTNTEVHGMTDKAMHMYIGTADDPLVIVRGGIFGGTLPHIECVLKAYIIALHQTLTDGYMGTEECIWAMIFARFPHLFAGFDNNSLGNHGDNCASFQANSMEADEIDKGKKEKFVSPPIPEKPSWWDDAIDGADGKPAAAVLRNSAKAKTGASARIALENLRRIGGVGSAPK